MLSFLKKNLKFYFSLKSLLLTVFFSYLFNWILLTVVEKMASSYIGKMGIGPILKIEHLSFICWLTQIFFGSLSACLFGIWGILEFEETFKTTSSKTLEKVFHLLSYLFSYTLFFSFLSLMWVLLFSSKLQTSAGFLLQSKAFWSCFIFEWGAFCCLLTFLSTLSLWVGPNFSFLVGIPLLVLSQAVSLLKHFEWLEPFFQEKNAIHTFFTISPYLPPFGELPFILWMKFRAPTLWDSSNSAWAYWSLGFCTLILLRLYRKPPPKIDSSIQNN